MTLTVVLAALAVAAVVGLNAAMRGKRRPLGTRDVMVRCRHGHVFMTRWTMTPEQSEAPRVQRCPVCHHWTPVTLVRDSDLTDAERQQAQRRWGDS